MIKKGFTLAEVLITLGIIGVAAAVAVPAFIGHMPCKNKMKFLKAYNMLTNVVADVIDDPAVYYDATGTGCKIFDCKGEIMDGPDYGVTDADSPYVKFAKIFYGKTSHSNSLDCTTSTTQCTFSSTNGMKWTFSAAAATSGIKISVDVNEGVGDKDNTNVDISTTTATKIVDTFAFEVGNDGTITPNDDLSKDLLASPSDLKRSSFMKTIKTIKSKSTKS